MIEPGFDAKLAHIRHLLAEAYEHYFAHSDGHCKSSEGAIDIGCPPFFWREDEPPQRPAVSIYSYVFGPDRMHYFKDIDEALSAVVVWHAQEMATDEDWG